MDQDFAVVAAAGSLRSSVRPDVVFPHKWTDDGVVVESDFTGAHLLHLAAAGCVLNDLYREAAVLGLPIAGVRVSASGGFDEQTWESTGIAYRVEIDSPAETDDLARLVAIVDDVAEIPRALRAGTTVVRG